jgi:hypothetical protein
MNIIEAFNRLKENPNLDLVMKSKYFTIIYEPDKKAFYQLEYYERGDGLFDEEYSRIDLEENIFCLNDILADDWEVINE